ncbi:hypothetical protein [Lysinibacter sp. HNR]|uniref:hypothetical protein n=1 Tax=Lysinibacter sp. HNR TaxID=3031408 RepID=UPI002435A4A1|nr:hypothetical protein [Lysinibacter sp. HNR]WGD38554.1 hypothetical protein FrondiHNR_06530 [Lysinibacter sp. HNR]
MRDAQELSDTTVDVPLTNVLVLTGGASPLAWSASFADPSIATFVPATDTGTLSTNPGITPLAAGRTAVTLTNADSGAVINFTLVVTS